MGPDWLCRRCFWLTKAVDFSRTLVSYAHGDSRVVNTKRQFRRGFVSLEPGPNRTRKRQTTLL